ncbi:MAG: hypothetical protein AAB036_09265 [Elusimicrobiota bacterium]
MTITDLKLVVESAGFIQAAIENAPAIASEDEWGIITLSLVPSKARPEAIRPAVQTGPLVSVPLLPLPELSMAEAPVFSSSFHQPTGPVAGGGRGGGVVALTVSMKAEVLETPPPVAVTMTDALPVAAEAEAERVNVEEQLGVQVTEPPWVTVLLLPLDSEKLKATGSGADPYS